MKRLLEKLKTLKLLVTGLKPAGEFINQVKWARAKYKTIPFWISLIGSLTAIVGAFQGLIPATTAVVITSILGALYNILRGIDKTDMVGVKPLLRTTEFWIGALAVVGNSLVEMKTGGVDSQLLTTAQTIVAAAMAAAQNLAANPPSVEGKK